MAIVTTIVPFLIVSRTKIVSSLKAGVGVVKFSGVNLQKSLLGLQLITSILILVTLYVFLLQSQFAVNADYGFEAEDLWFIDLKDMNGELLQNEVESTSIAKRTSLVSDVFGFMLYQPPIV